MFRSKRVCLDILKKEKIRCKKVEAKVPDGGGIKAVKDNV